MNPSDLLQQAIQAARNGDELVARDFFLDVVNIDPENEVAWIWLSGLFDPLEERISACERVLFINPNNYKIRSYLDELQEEQKKIRRNKIIENNEKLQKIRGYLDNGRKDDALFQLQTILRDENGYKEGWLLFAELSINIHDKVRAYEAILQIDSTEMDAHKNLEYYRYYQNRQLDLAAVYEGDGEIEKALDLYRFLAAEAKNAYEFDQIFKNITRIEDTKAQKIRYVQPIFHILRLSLGLPLLYLLEVFIQEGLSPIKHPAPALWLGIPIVTLGSFLIAVAAVPSRHVIWQKWFGDHTGRGSMTSRSLVTFAGWMLVLPPHFLLVWNSVIRLQTFETPLIPWFN